MGVIREIKAFSKAQISAFLGGVVDYGIMLGCVELFGSHYITGIVIGGIIGAAVNYTINRRWSFRGQFQKPQGQILNFILIVLGSIVLKSGGTSFFTEIVRIDYRISRLITDAFVSFGFNYMLQRYWIFRKQMVKLESQRD